MDVGNEFMYEVSETVSDREGRKTETFLERFVVTKVNSDEVYFKIYRNDILSRYCKGYLSDGNGYFSRRYLKKEMEQIIPTVFGDRHVSMFCGKRNESTMVMYEGDVVYRYEITHSLSNGVSFETVYDLVRFDVT